VKQTRFYARQIAPDEVLTFNGEVFDGSAVERPRIRRVSVQVGVLPPVKRKGVELVISGKARKREVGISGAPIHRSVRNRGPGIH
jgi:hypothetical protein